MQILVSCLCRSQPPNLRLPQRHPPLGYQRFVFYICEYFCSVNKFIYTIFLDSTYKQHHMMFVFLWLHLRWSSRGPSMLLPMALFHSSLWPLLNIAASEPNQRIQAAMEPSLLAEVGVIKHMVAFLICRWQKKSWPSDGGKILLEVVVVKGLRF